MKTRDVIEHYGSQQKLAKALGLAQPTISAWGEDVPPLRQLQIEKITDGKFKAAADVFASRKHKPD